MCVYEVNTHDFTGDGTKPSRNEWLLLLLLLLFLFLQFLCALVLVLAILLVNLVGVDIIVINILLLLPLLPLFALLIPLGLPNLWDFSWWKKRGVPKRRGFLLGSTPLRAGRWSAIPSHWMGRSAPIHPVCPCAHVEKCWKMYVSK